VDAGDGRYRAVRGILERGADQIELDPTFPIILRPIGAFLRPGGVCRLAAGGALTATLETLRLRQLKLLGMLDSIAARVQEARARPLWPCRTWP